MFVPYWRQNSAASAVLIPGWYRIGYELTQRLIPGLEKEIRTLHKLVGNAVIDGRYLVVGTGEMQLMMAAYSTVSMEAEGLPVNVVIPPPYYDAYERQVKTIKPGTVTWGMPSLTLQNTENWIPLEVVISPNNPDGSIRTGALKHPRTRTVYDHAYYWPHYTPITGPLDDDLMLFTLSKTTGHAGSRIGWAIIKDHEVYQKMQLFVVLNSVGVSHEAQLRAAQLLRSAREGYQKAKNVGLDGVPTDYAAQQLLFHFAHTKLRSRWDRMNQLFQASNRFLIAQDRDPKYCNFFKEIVRPGPAFAWIHCQREEDKSCLEIFKEAGIVARGGARASKASRPTKIVTSKDAHSSDCWQKAWPLNKAQIVKDIHSSDYGQKYQSNALEQICFQRNGKWPLSLAMPKTESKIYHPW
ncbi:hypothetical protein GOP47_0018713 [Adiantum capillus-veneris]|uniref:Alliinase C-terminal domain-containing protein n=1 Tax=Adiantum capillus-veneris TaxID=13818 RepID=A0A9D4UF00_ADICA|nr:hypothetical protein GOP47_0018713 [Adiantum capillus-veneris]